MGCHVLSHTQASLWTLNPKRSPQLVQKKNNSSETAASHIIVLVNKNMVFWPHMWPSRTWNILKRSGLHVFCPCLLMLSQSCPESMGWMSRSWSKGNGQFDDYQKVSRAPITHRFILIPCWLTKSRSHTKPHQTTSRKSWPNRSTSTRTSLFEGAKES